MGAASVRRGDTGSPEPSGVGRAQTEDRGRKHRENPAWETAAGLLQSCHEPSVPTPHRRSIARLGYGAATRRVLDARAARLALSRPRRTPAAKSGEVRSLPSGRHRSLPVSPAAHGRQPSPRLSRTGAGGEAIPLVGRGAVTPPVAVECGSRGLDVRPWARSRGSARATARPASRSCPCGRRSSPPARA